jgi:AcrR family transcriptional regulator
MGRPKQPLLSAELIADAALELIDETGALQMIALARRLSVAPSSLYNHVAGREEVVELLRTRIAESVGAGSPGGATWQEGVRSALDFSIEMYGRHLKAMMLLFEQAIGNSNVLAWYERVAGILAEAGFDLEDISAIISLLDATAIGLAMDSRVPEQLWELDTIDNEDLPTLRSAQLRQPNKQARSLIVRRLAIEAIITRLEHMLEN